MPEISKIKLPNENIARDIKDASAPARPLGDGYSKAGTLPISSTDTISEAIGKLENSMGSGGGSESAGCSAELDTLKTLKQPDTWTAKTWTGLTSFRGVYVWTDGENIYYSYQSNQYVLNKATSTWSTNSWTGLTSFYGLYIWTDGDNIYYSYGTSQYVLNKSTSTWSSKSWTGLTNFYGHNVWTDGDNIYYSNSSSDSGTVGHYILDKTTGTWTTKTWSGRVTSFSGRFVWTDGNDVYYSGGNSYQCVLDKSTSTWNTKTWNGFPSSMYINGLSLFTYDDNIYYLSYDSNTSTAYSYVLDKSTSTWIPKTWNNGGSGSTWTGYNVWTDGDNIYFSYDSTHYVLKKPLKTTKIPNVLTNSELTSEVSGLRAAVAPFYSVPINHNMIYRGNNLGATLTNAQHTALSSGNFTDLYLGDYWTKRVTIPAGTYTGGDGEEVTVAAQTVTLKAVIADFDTFYAGYTTFLSGINTHHAAVIVHGFNNVVWNKTNSTAGGYISSLIHKWLVGSVLPQIETWFDSDKVLSHYKLLTNAITGDAASSYTWSSQKISLLSECQLYGMKVWGGSRATNGAYDPGEALKHLNVFNHIDADLLFGFNMGLWLRDISSAKSASALNTNVLDSVYTSASISPVAIILLS